MILLTPEEDDSSIGNKEALKWSSCGGNWWWRILKKPL